jgi:hypothetical protein
MNGDPLYVLRCLVMGEFIDPRMGLVAFRVVPKMIRTFQILRILHTNYAPVLNIRVSHGTV